jgi:acetyl esterase/lipase
MAVTAITSQEKVIDLWPGVAPGSENWMQKEGNAWLPQVAKGSLLIRNVTQPTLTAFLPDASIASSTAVVICPGGGFQFLPWEHEGTEIAKWLNSRGVAAFVLKYRLIDTGPTEEDFQKSVAQFLSMVGKLGTAPPEMRVGLPESMQKIAPLAVVDGLQALRIARRHASEWNIAPDRIGMMGFSVGAVVTMGVLVQDDEASRPSFVAAIYGAGMERFAPSREAIPLFVISAADDPISASGSEVVYSKWRAAGNPIEAHIYARGGHGFGLNPQNLPTDHWIERFREWLQGEGLLKSIINRQPTSQDEGLPGYQN